MRIEIDAMPFGNERNLAEIEFEIRQVRLENTVPGSIKDQINKILKTEIEKLREA